MRSTQAFRASGFKGLFAAYTVNEAGTFLGEIALTIAIFDQTGSGIATALFFLAIELIPALLSPALVVRAELAGSRRALPVLYIAEAALFLVLAWLVNGEFLLAIVLVVAAADGTLGLVTRALVRASAAEVLKPEQLLREGNSLMNIGYSVSFAAGPVLAAVLVAGVSVSAALLVNATSFLVVAIILFVARTIPNVQAEPDPWRQRLREGVAYVKKSQLLSRLFLAQGLASICIGITVPLEVLLAKETLGAGNVGYAFLLGSWSIGLVIGSFIFDAARHVSLGRILLVSTTAMALAFVGFSIAPTIVVACAFAVAGGLGNGCQWVSVMTTVQAIASEDYQARAVSLLNSIGWMAPGIGFVLAGAIASLSGPRQAFAIAGGGLIVVVIVAVAWLHKADWPIVESSEEGESVGPSANELEEIIGDPVVGP